MQSSPCLAVPLTCLLYVCDVIICTYILRAAHFGAELGDIIVGSSRGVAICGVVRACTLHGREHCAGGGCPGRTWRERHTEGLRAGCPRVSDRSRVKKRIHPTTAHFACDHPDVGQARASQHGHVGGHGQGGVGRAHGHVRGAGQRAAGAAHGRAEQPEGGRRREHNQVHVARQYDPGRARHARQPCGQQHARAAWLIGAPCRVRDAQDGLGE